MVWQKVYTCPEGQYVLASQYVHISISNCCFNYARSWISALSLLSPNWGFLFLLTPSFPYFSLFLILENWNPLPSFWCSGVRNSFCRTQLSDFRSLLWLLELEYLPELPPLQTQCTIYDHIWKRYLLWINFMILISLILSRTSATLLQYLELWLTYKS